MAAKPSPTKPRKSALQARSRLTVDALLEATARILVREGYDRASTNRIAQAAGVSIGSLYQYFPSKEALVAAVIDRHMQEMMGLVREALARMAEQPLEVAVRELVTVMIDAHRVDPKLHRVLVEHTPRLGKSGNVEAIDREVFALVHNYLEARWEELGVPDLDVAAFICVSTVEALTHSAVMGNFALLQGGAGTLINETTRLLVSYLTGDGADAKGVSNRASPRRRPSREPA